MIKYQMKKVIVRAVLSFWALLTALILLEILLRLFTPVPENLAKLQSSTLFLHENKPNAVFPYSISDGVTVEIAINSDGFRDDQFTHDKASDVYRIAVLGDSQEEALQVELADTWQKVMARKLSRELAEKASGPEGPFSESETAPSQRPTRRVESYNFGVSGYGTDQQWLTLREKVWQFQPDMVILAFSPNDVGDTYKNKLVKVESGSPRFAPASTIVAGEAGKLKVVDPKDRMGGNWLGKLVRETYIYHLVVKASLGNQFFKKLVDDVRISILGFVKEERFFLSDAQLVQGPFEVVASQKNPPREVLDSWSLIKVILADMKRQANEHKAVFLLTINIPKAQVQAGDWDHLQKTYKLDPNSSSAFEINEVLSEAAKDLEINFYDPRLDGLEWKNQNGDLHFALDAHYSKNGNLFMGTKVAEFILNNKLIDSLSN
ncbi:SGNH/GDSL hydrolase family protein [Candidatus Curtissbacteria bacterium]|nr:SGNH/GDSL hydrolase family protein [Candidatus Curtissbacteria bacterium]